MQKNTAKKSLLGAAIIGVLGALAAGFFQSAGQFAGDVIFPSFISSPSEPHAEEETSVRNANETASYEGVLEVGSGASLVEVNRISLTFGGQGSGDTRGGACRSALESANDQSTLQCKRIAEEQEVQSFKIERQAESCSACSQLSSGWRCLAEAHPICVLLD